MTPFMNPDDQHSQTPTAQQEADTYVWDDETALPPAPQTDASWKVLVVDDDESVHAVTRLALTGFTFLDRTVQTLHALSAAQAQPLILQHTDIALALVDVVMETEQAGLELVRWIREVAGNRLMRIVMRTGQAAQLPEEAVVRDYDIDDFRQKTDLQLKALRTLVMSRLRAWDGLCVIETHRRELSALVAQRTRELDNARMRLVQADRVASIGQLAAGVAHSLNTPLGYLASNMRALEDALPTLLAHLNPAEAGDLCEDLPALVVESRQGIEAMRRTVQDLLVFARPDTADARQWTELNANITATVALNEAQLQVPIVLELAQLPMIECHPAQINLVLVQLLNNAAQAMQGRTGSIVVQSGLNDRGVWFSVRDSGCGMTEAVCQRMFEPFFTTRPFGQGQGLGLALVWGVVQAHQGSIDVESIVDVGSTITVTLPRESVDRTP